MDLKLISELIKMMENSKLSALEVESNELRVKLEKGSSYGLVRTSPESSQNFNKPAVRYEDCETVSESAVESISVENTAPAEKPAASLLDEKCLVVPSPIVGTFYLSPSPDSEPFVSVGQKVKKGDTLCIIEAMKLMNEIESELDGEIVEILVKNGSMVEYGQPLFKLK
jgi:acetyl-CoA carboxylase biotin carboxyl carrier protein